MQFDPDTCSAYLRGVTEQLAGRPRRSGGSVTELIDQVREANAWANDALRTALSKRFPHIHWAESERNTELHRNPEHDGSYWVYDPIDGAYHFLQGLPLWSASLALVDQGRTVASFVYDPCLKEMFVAVRGHGSFLNGKRLAASKRTTLDSAVVAATLPSFAFDGAAATEATIKSIASVVPRVFSLRLMASSSLQLAYVAAGRLDAYWSLDGDMYDWLAGALLAREAGASVTDMTSSELNWGSEALLASAPALSETLSALLDPGT